MNDATDLRPALERAATNRFLYLLLRPGGEGHQDELRALAPEVPACGSEELSALLQATDEEVIAEGFRVLIPAGPVSLATSNYVEDGYVDKGPILGDIAGFYRAFGFTPTLSEAPDHLASIFEFLSFLELKEAWATREADEEQAELCRDAEKKLVDQHVHPYLSRFAERLRAVAPAGGFYAAAAAFIERVCREPELPA